ncbi:MAG: hypothetical protein EXR68_02730 [Dehalococcoidia bacterium]|nr:hypothetical protein [Dehalococcoidia bacterium]
MRVADGGLTPTVALEDTLRTPARLEVLIACGPAGLAEPCAADRIVGPWTDATLALRTEGHRRLAERVWRTQHLAAEVGREATWRMLLDRALASSAGRRAE